MRQKDEHGLERREDQRQVRVVCSVDTHKHGWRGDRGGGGGRRGEESGIVCINVSGGRTLAAHHHLPRLANRAQNTTDDGRG